MGIIIRNVDDIETKIGLTDYDRGLVEAAHLLACLAIPWAWLLGLSLPTAMGATRSSMDELDLNLKTARQNQTRNVLNLKYKHSLCRLILRQPLQQRTQATPRTIR